MPEGWPRFGAEGVEDTRLELSPNLTASEASNSFNKLSGKMDGPPECGEKHRLVQKVAKARVACLDSIKLLSEESAQFDDAQEIASSSCAVYESAVAELKRHISAHHC